MGLQIACAANFNMFAAFEMLLCCMQIPLDSPLHVDASPEASFPPVVAGGAKLLLDLGLHVSGMALVSDKAAAQLACISSARVPLAPELAGAKHLLATSLTPGGRMQAPGQHATAWLQERGHALPAGDRLHDVADALMTALYWLQNRDV
jgi:hypothetical protein